ncbi:hypothetical protein Sjap_004162 [Stephania japonica]|uniref:Uncharacterized protein n=1 Tax=Stephania japonica TaxID=461633 RepID=A0AAP0K2K6_9MAGN
MLRGMCPSDAVLVLRHYPERASVLFSNAMVLPLAASFIDHIERSAVGARVLAYETFCELLDLRLAKQLRAFVARALMQRISNANVNVSLNDKIGLPYDDNNWKRSADEVSLFYLVGVERKGQCCRCFAGAKIRSDDFASSLYNAEARAPPCWNHGGELKLPSNGPSAPPTTGADCAGASGGWPEGHRPPCPATVKTEEGWRTTPFLPSPWFIWGSYGVGKEEPPSGAPTPFSGEDGVPLWGPTAHSSGDGGEAIALALMMPPPPPP